MDGGYCLVLILVWVALGAIVRCWVKSGRITLRICVLSPGIEETFLALQLFVDCNDCRCCVFVHMVKCACVGTCVHVNCDVGWRWTSWSETSRGHKSHVSCAYILIADKILVNTEWDSL